MLVELNIQNFVIIKNLEIRFRKSMTVLIDETSTGKSILTDALSLLLGHCTQSEMIRSGEKKAVVTGLFTPEEGQEQVIENLCFEYGLPLNGDDLIISRELSNERCNVTRINGQLTTITVLAQIRQYLVDTHGQSDQRMLMDQERQIGLVNEYAGAIFKVELEKYQSLFKKWVKLTNKSEYLQERAQELVQGHDILQFQKDGLSSAGLADIDEDEKLEQEYSELNNYQKIVETVSYLMQVFDDDEHGLTTLLGNARNAADELTEYGSDFKDMTQSLSDGVYSLSDGRSELDNIMDNLDFDEERFQYVTNRLNTLNNLRKEYGPDLSDIFNFYRRISKEPSQLEVGGLDENKLQKEASQLEDNMATLARKLHQTKEKTSSQLEKEIRSELADLFMERAGFSIRFVQSKIFNKLGTDKVAFYIVPNPSEELMPLMKIVSGGKRSRLILALKAIFLKVEPVDTMVFDEIDTGVSGRVSAAIGKEIRSIGQQEQVIAVTRSVQITASSDWRYKVEEHVEDGNTFTQVCMLDDQESVRAITQMVAGISITATAEQDVADLIKRSHEK